MRPDLQVIHDWVTPNSRVLDLGCGDGSLISSLTELKSVQAYGLEIDEDNIEACVRRGVNVIQYNLDAGLSAFNDKSFDLVVMTQALQAVNYPDKVLDEMLRIAGESIITFPNFAHWKCRTYLLLNGKMPVSKSLPYSWYDTPNIHLCTFKDFERLCRQRQIKIINRTVVDHAYHDSFLMRRFPNLFGEIAIYHVRKQ